MGSNTEEQQHQSPLDMTVITSLSDLNEFQGMILHSEAEALHLDRLQRDYIQSALRNGFGALSSFELNTSIETSLSSSFERFFREFVPFVKAMELPASAEEAPITFAAHAAKLKTILQSIHADTEMTEQQIIFAEFIIGLGRFKLDCFISRYVTDKFGLQYEKKQGESSAAVSASAASVLTTITDPAETAIETIDALTARAASMNVDDVWTEIYQACIADEHLHRALKQDLFSMILIPDDKNYLSAMQALHWSGFGGSFEWLKDFEELKFLKPHALSWNPRGTDQDGEHPHFQKRMQLMFGTLVGRLRTHANSVAAEFISQQMPTQTEIKVYDVCSGDVAAGVSGIARLLPNKTFKVTVSDTSAASLAASYKYERGEAPVAKPSNLEIVTRRYEDLTGELKVAGLANSADIFSASIGLHQLTDGIQGMDLLANVIRYGTAITRVGGLIVNPDVDENAFIQDPVIPGNGVDREGCVPSNIYEKVKFTDVAVANMDNFKIPYPLSKLKHAEPQSVVNSSQNRAGIYNYTPYIIVEISSEELKELEAARTAGNFAECDAIIQRKIDITGIQNGIRSSMSSTLSS